MYMWWRKLYIPALGGLGQEDHREFQSSLGYTVKPYQSVLALKVRGLDINPQKPCTYNLSAGDMETGGTLASQFSSIGEPQVSDIPCLKTQLDCSKLCPVLTSGLYLYAHCTDAHTGTQTGAHQTQVHNRHRCTHLHTNTVAKISSLGKT